MFRRLSLLSKIWLSTSVALTVVFATTGLLLQRHAFDATARSVDEGVKTGFQAYETVWRTRGEMLRTVANIVSRMPNVRAAFGTRDGATIRDSAGEVWSSFSDELKQSTFFLVTTPEGAPIAMFNTGQVHSMPQYWPSLREARSQFPRQVSGTLVAGDQLVETVLTPVYIDSGQGRALINVLVAGYPINSVLAQGLKESTGGSEFLFLAPGRVFASTLNARATGVLAAKLAEGAPAGRISDGVRQYAVRVRELTGPQGARTGRLIILRSYDSAAEHLVPLRRDLVLMWLFAVVGGLALSYWVVRRIVRPVQILDRAAAEVSRQNYSYRVDIDSGDELGRLGDTFNSMCASLQSAREELIRQERISTIGRLASSIVHDLRNPLAAIYGGSELLVDDAVPEAQKRRLAGNLFRAAQRIQAMLQDLANISRGKSRDGQLCPLAEVIDSAVESSRAAADAVAVRICVDVPRELEIVLERDRMERVFLNLIGNALEAMPQGGELTIRARSRDGFVIIEVEDSGPGISEEIRTKLFQPFVTFGKRNGLGLGLALSRQTVLDHGGEIWVDTSRAKGACFLIRLPVRKPQAAIA